MYPVLSPLSGEQIRAGRALARIDQADLAKRCGLSLETIKRLESIRGPVGANSRTLQALLAAFATMGISFERDEGGGEGVCMEPRSFRDLERGSRSYQPRGVPAETQHGDTRCHRLIYYSTASVTAPEPLHQLLEDVRVCGAQPPADLDVTGMIYAGNGRFLGVLEGQKDNVRQLFGSISCDARHGAITVLSDQPASARRFRDWTVGCGLFPSDLPVLGAEPALRDGFHPEALSPASALGFVSLMRDLADEAPRDGLKSRVPCPLAGTCLDRVCAPRAA